MVALSKEQIKEMDRAMLLRWAAGELEKDLRRDYPKVKVRVNCYRALGVVSGTVNEGNKAVDWARFEEVDPPGMRNRGGSAPRTSNTESNTPAPLYIAQSNTLPPPRIAPRNTESNTLPPARIAPSNTLAIQEEDLAVVKEVVAWWRGREAPSPARKGPKQAVTFRLEVDLIEALRGAADREGVPVVEILRRAVERYLGGKS